MKSLLNVLILLSVSISFSQKDYTLQINDQTIEISLDEDTQIRVDGKMLNVKLSAKDTLVYDDELFSFKYSSDYKISKLELDEGITQIMLMTAEGSGVLVQQYSTMNPTMLNEMMITEVTKESLNYGYEMKREKISKTLVSGQTIEVDKAVLTYKDDKSVYEVATIGGTDEGLLIMTMISIDSMKSQGSKIIETMWNTLIYK